MLAKKAWKLLSGSSPQQIPINEMAEIGRHHSFNGSEFLIISESLAIGQRSREFHCPCAHPGIFLQALNKQSSFQVNGAENLQ